VAIAIGVIAVDLIGSEGGATFELGVGDVDTSVDDVSADAAAGAAIIGVGAATS
jgi:hypothetical protein